jgi:hypothetical protein
MTQSQFDRALARATVEGLRIIGRGTIKATGQKFYAVSSSTGDGCYVVIIAGQALVCNCPARGYCKHRALVRHTVMSEAAAAQAAAPIACAQPALEEPMREDDWARETALPMRQDTGPRLYRL